jgi:hypothetical protein
MRFFSNDKDKSNDEQSNVDVQTRAEDLNPEQAHDDHPERVSSEPVAVPQQRSGSPWADAPGTPADDTADAELADAERADGTEERPPFHEPGPQPTAFGASTVGGAVAASAMANPENDRWDVMDRQSDAASGVADDRSVAPGDGVVTDAASPWATGPDGDATQRADAGDRADESGEDRADAVDVALEDRGTFEDPNVRDELADTGGPDATPPDAAVEAGTATYGPDRTVTTTDTDRTESDTDTDRVAGEPALRDEGGFDEPTAVDPATGQPLDTDTDQETAEDRDTLADRDTVADRDTLADRDTVADRDTTEERDTGTGFAAADAAAGAAAGAAGATATDRATGTPARDTDRSLFGSDAQGFHERWREVQLRFVDSPKDATTDAAALLDEAVEKLTTNLRTRKDSLTQDSDDTEQLRVQLRGYRDMINRILDL